MSEVINFEKAKAKTEQPSLEERRKEAIKKLPHYRGEVQSKNTIRQLPGVEPGQIFWVEMDHKPYLVAEKDGKKITIKALDETATVSTGITIFEMNKSIISKEPLMDFSDPQIVADLDARLNTWFNEETSDKRYLLYGRDIHYVTMLERTGNVKTWPAQILRDCLSAIGDIISVDFNTSDGECAVEIWIRTKDSPAELLYLFPYDKGIVEF